MGKPPVWGAKEGNCVWPIIFIADCFSQSTRYTYIARAILATGKFHSKFPPFPATTHMDTMAIAMILFINFIPSPALGTNPC